MIERSVKIIFLTDYLDCEKGEIIYCHKEYAKILIEKGVAEYNE